MPVYGDSKVYFAPGSFDDWCIYVERDGQRFAPTDLWYFGVLEDWDEYLVPDFIYYDFITIYEAVATDVTPAILELIERNFGRGNLIKDTRVERGVICASCGKRCNSCRCGCSYCWGNQNRIYY